MTGKPAPRTPGTRARRGGLVAGMLVAAALVSFAGPMPEAQAQRYQTHRVKKGDTLALLAGEIYGDRRYAILIMATNKLDHDAELRPGKRLKIPTNHAITTNAGDTLASLAEQHLGDPRRQKFLADFNGISAGASLPVGMTIKVPLVVQHRTAGKEKLSDIAAAYFGTAKKTVKTRLIREYNFLTANTLDAGRSISIPIDNVEVRPSRQPKPDADSKARAEKRKKMQKMARRALAKAEKAWHEGDHDTVKGLLTTLDTAYLDAEDAVQIDVLLGRTYIAFDDTDTALARFKKALERAPDHLLDPYFYSPKVLEVWRNAGGRVQGSD